MMLFVCPRACNGCISGAHVNVADNLFGEFALDSAYNNGPTEIEEFGWKLGIV